MPSDAGLHVGHPLPTSSARTCSPTLSTDDRPATCCTMGLTRSACPPSGTRCQTGTHPRTRTEANSSTSTAVSGAGRRLASAPTRLRRVATANVDCYRWIAVDRPAGSTTRGSTNPQLSKAQADRSGLIAEFRQQCRLRECAAALTGPALARWQRGRHRRRPPAESCGLTRLVEHGAPATVQCALQPTGR